MCILCLQWEAEKITLKELKRAANEPGFEVEEGPEHLSDLVERAEIEIDVQIDEALRDFWYDDTHPLYPYDFED